MPPLRGIPHLDAPTAAAGAATAPTRPVLNGRPGGASAALRSGSPSTGAGANGQQKQSALQSDILAVLKQAARQEPAAALRELQRLHGQLTGAAGSKALASLELSLKQNGPEGGGSAADIYMATSAGGGSSVAASATANAINAQQRELNQLTIQRQRLQGQQREMRTELHSTSAELEKRKSELRQVTEQLKARRNVLKEGGAQGTPRQSSPRAPSPPRGSPGRASEAESSSSPGYTASGEQRGPTSSQPPSSQSSSGEGAQVPRLPVGGAAKHSASASPSATPAQTAPATGASSAKTDGEAEGGGSKSGDSDEKLDEKLEALNEELEETRGDLQLTIADLRVILEATPAFVAAVDPLGLVSGWNTAAIELTGLRRDGVLQRHFVEHFVPQPDQQAVADAMEAAFSMPADDPLAAEPGEPFELTLWRGGAADRDATVSLHVRAYARRQADGRPVGLLLIQEDATANETLRNRIAVEKEVVELNAKLESREQELDEHEAELMSLRQELQGFYEEKAREAGRPLKPTPKPSGKPPGILQKGPSSQQRVAWGAPNKVGHFTKGSSPREFGNKARHDAMRVEALGTQQPP